MNTILLYIHLAVIGYISAKMVEYVNENRKPIVLELVFGLVGLIAVFGAYAYAIWSLVRMVIK